MPVLDPVKHERLIMDKDHILQVANISEEALNTSMLDACTPKQVDWVRQFNAHRKEHSGAYIVGAGYMQPQLITAALVRNFIDARIITLDILLSHSDTSSVPDPTVMVVPNFYHRSYGKTLPAWKVSLLYDILLRRRAGERQTLLVLEEVEPMMLAYGPALHDLILSTYIRL